MINTTLNKIINSIPTFNKIASQNFDIKTAYLIAKIIQQLKEEIELFNQSKNLLLTKYNAQKNDKNEFIIPKENIESFNKEIKELLNIEVKINTDKIEINNLNNIQCSPLEIESIIDFIK